MSDEKRAPHSGESGGSKHPKVLSTTLGVVLAANLIAAPALHAEDAASGSDEHQPNLVEWSTDEVKPFYNPSVDWNIELPQTGAKDTGQGTGAAASSTPTPAAGTGTGGGSGGSTVIVEGGHGGGFGWDDILLYHFLFNNGGTYSTSAWSQTHTVVDARTQMTYRARTFAADAFENRPVEGSTVRPKTSSSAGSFTTRASKSTSSSSGSIGGKSSSFSSSGRSSGSSFGS